MEWVLTKDKAPARKAVTVSALTHQIKGLLETSLSDVWVEGELSGVSRPRSGHVYFTLKDARASLSCVMWRSAARSLKMELSEGLKVLVRGPISVYPPRGSYQLVAERIEPLGLGELQAAFEQLKKRLEAEGLFDRGRKQPLPAAPIRIGVVTSATGAAIRDVLQVLGRRYPLTDVVLAPARVQGRGAADEIAAAVEDLASVEGVEVILVTRGGGSLEDLWAFNEETVARAIAECPVPVMSAVGHEIDFTIADFVADARAPTPSAAAELLVPDALALRRTFEHLEERLLVGQRRRLERAKLDVQALAKRLVDPRRRLIDKRQRLAELEGRLTDSMGRLLERQRARSLHLHETLGRLTPTAKVARLTERNRGLQRQLVSLMSARIERGRGEVARQAGKLDALSPLRVLGRGYAIATHTSSGAVLRRFDDVSVGDGVDVRLGAGHLSATVTEVHEPSTDG